jgi:GntR family transcriptional repressor for pyruvate dehydrogenase complex
MVEHRARREPEVGMIEREQAPTADGFIRSRVPLGQRVADALARDIVERGLRDGDPLPSEAELATRFQVSVRVVRDALRALSNQGIIATSQGKRATVSDLRPSAVEAYFKFAVANDQQAIAELFDVRIALETRAAGLAAENATSEDLERIAGASAEMARSRTDVERYAAADLDWHAAIVDAAHNRFLSGINAALAEILRRERTQGAQLRARAGGSADATRLDHARILDAVKAADRSAAEAAMLEHLERASRVFRAYLAALDESPR